MNASGRPVDYLVIGQIAKDITALGPTLEGTAAYSSLSAQALGKEVAIITSLSRDPHGPFAGSDNLLKRIPVRGLATLDRRSYCQPSRGILRHTVRYCQRPEVYRG